MSELGDFAIDLYDAFAPDDKCRERCEHGGICCLDVGHDEPHDSDGNCRWETADD